MGGPTRACSRPRHAQRACLTSSSVFALAAAEAPKSFRGQTNEVRCVVRNLVKSGILGIFGFLSIALGVYLPGISSSDPARDLAGSASRHHLRFRRPIRVVPTFNCLRSRIDSRRFVCVLVLHNVSNAPVYVPTMSDLYINDVFRTCLATLGRMAFGDGHSQ